MSYKRYQEEYIEDIKNTLDEMGTQPILFIGSGLSKRYFQAPNWIELLEILKQRCPEIPEEVGSYIQDGLTPEEIGSIFTKHYKKWAWKNKGKYPENLFKTGTPIDVYIKHEIKNIFEEITPLTLDRIENTEYIQEIEYIRDIQPHAVITTNYDTFLETILPDYQPIVGQEILRPDTMSIGEIFKIHGSVTNIKELVFNNEDYESFLKKKKYLSAKLLTFFAEHPLLFIGYSGKDQNIQAILSDIDEIISINGELISNIYFLSYNPNLTESAQPKKEKIFVIQGKEIRVKHIEANSFKWILEAFAANKAVENVHPKLLRALLARTYKLVRSDIPRRSVDVNFEMISNILENDEDLPKLYGVSILDNAGDINFQFPFTLTQVGESLGYNGWHGADDLILKIKREKGINIKASDNKYHVTIQVGKKTRLNKYSKEALDLLKKVQSGMEYSVDIQGQSALKHPANSIR
ncbi:TPA: SIR2 family protein [Bacillus cereus]|nr:SIR2 family protein [Bacillus cereus]HDR4738803.1 SIR2 family protein [Bacillus cereus]HDR4747649.1 SIR2 family protein [Bacillus cereus]HDR4750935.1 SIR2 family protein [Bacillus cereus]HDR4770334.1 SIR2 family protein [Bacillus cereus]